MSELKEEIKKDVVDQLYWDDRVDAGNITVSIEDGTVILEGSVASFAEKKAASADAWSVHGVRAVANEITVAFPSTIEVPTDEEIRENVKKALELASDIEDKDIVVIVNNGIVILKGSVPSYWQKSRIEHIIAGITGVFEINDTLTIVPTKNFIDKEIAEDIISALERNYSVDAEKIDVLVEDGIVTLSGDVNDWRAYDAAMNTARFTAGVIHIVDHLEIKGDAL
ncbi:MAG: BON domain-containing protein [Candidatus Lokiarchaeota archaeon]|nr:BON domain-containing protein [Candidatus Lokiarchaeota archaeon]